MKKLLGIMVLGLLWCNVSVAAETIYLACGGMITANRSDSQYIKLLKVGEDMIAYYFEIDSGTSLITAHEDWFVGEPEKIGTAKIKKIERGFLIEFKKRDDSGKMIYRFRLTRDAATTAYDLDGTHYIKANNTLDIDFSGNCMPLKKAKYKIYITKGFD